MIESRESEGAYGSQDWNGVARMLEKSGGCGTAARPDRRGWLRDQRRCVRMRCGDYQHLWVYRGCKTGKYRNDSGVLPDEGTRAG